MAEPSFRTQMRRDQTLALHRQQILDAAEFLFGTRGYGEVSMEDVAERCLFSRRTLYRYFATKEALAGALSLQALTELLEDFQATSREPGNGLVRVRRLGDCLGRFAFEKTSRFQSMRLRWFVGVPDEVKASLIGQIVVLNRGLEALMTEAVQAGIRDGSIRPLATPEAAVVALMGSSAGLLDAVATFGPRFASVYGVEPATAWQAHLDLVEAGLASS